jgi:RNA polymerase sigma factor (sigma-70 family)
MGRSQATPGAGATAGRSMSEPNWDYLLSEQVRQNGRVFYRLAYRFLRDDAAAQDVCQQAFRLAWEHRARIDPSGKTLGSWISRTVKTECLQRVRREKIARRVLANHAAVQPDSAADPRVKRELREAVMAALDRLPERTRSIIKMRYYDGMTPAEISIRLGCNATEIWRQLQRGFEQLRGVLPADWRDDTRI